MRRGELLDSLDPALLLLACLLVRVAKLALRRGADINAKNVSARSQSQCLLGDTPIRAPPMPCSLHKVPTADSLIARSCLAGLLLSTKATHACISAGRLVTAKVWASTCCQRVRTPGSRTRMVSRATKVWRKMWWAVGYLGTMTMTETASPTSYTPPWLGQCCRRTLFVRTSGTSMRCVAVIAIPDAAWPPGRTDVVRACLGCWPFWMAQTQGPHRQRTTAPWPWIRGPSIGGTESGKPREARLVWLHDPHWPGFEV